MRSLDRRQDDVRHGDRGRSNPPSRLATAAAAGLLAVLTACGPAPSRPRPLVPLTENGVVPVTIAGIRLEPGQTADFDVYVVNASTTTVHVVGARLVGLPGHRTPVLVQVAVETGVNSVGSQVGWPPDGVSLGGGDELSLTPGVNRIAVGATPPRHGVFVATGLLLSYGQGRSAVAWGGSVSCAVAHPASGRWCSRHERGLDTRIRAFIRSGGRG